MALASSSDRPESVEPPIVTPKPESRHCWLHVSPSQGSEGEPVFLLGWAHNPSDQIHQLSWWAQIVRMDGPTDWSVDWVSSSLISPHRYAQGDPPPGGRRSSADGRQLRR